MVAVTGWRRWRGLPLAPAESVVSLVATLSGQSLASVRDLYKRKATCEYSFGFVFFPSGMATYSYATRLAWLTGRFGLSLPAANQLPAAALREAPPNSDGSKGKLLSYCLDVMSLNQTCHLPLQFPAGGRSPCFSSGWPLFFSRTT